MNGKTLIDKLCSLLENEGSLVYDSQIIRKLSELSSYELKQLITEKK